MTDASSAPNTSRPVTMTKSGSSRETPTERPQQVLIGAVLMVVAGVLGLLASLTLFLGSVDAHGNGSGVMKWLFDNNVKALTKTSVGAALRAKVDDNSPTAAIQHLAYTTISTEHKGYSIQALVVLAALAFVAYGMYRGRYWVRWGSIAVLFLTWFTQSNIGVTGILGVAGNAPLLYKVPAFLGALTLIGAVVIANLRPNIAWFNLTRPAPRPGQAQRRGLFSPAPRQPAASSRNVNGSKTPAPTRPASTVLDHDRARTKKRATVSSTAKGAELARSRAKAASKSRRTEA